MSLEVRLATKDPSIDQERARASRRDIHYSTSDVASASECDRENEERIGIDPDTGAHVSATSDRGGHGS